ncbi:MAG: lysine transporter LysE [Actinobacteria bacterium HGW-Actinobacteria-2]|nr:MAG: lysine transporter LysE [Actinobacteria bacterium HGW-Actinobacteria-2]
MTLTQSLLGFGLLAAVLALTPGLDTVFVLRQALRSGRAAAFAAGAGVCVGTLVWGVASAVGVAALLVASQLAFTALRWVGIAYLCWLAFGYLRSAWRGLPPAELGTDGAESVRTAALKGMATTLTNPKMAVFYLTVLPLFLPAGYPPALAGAMLALLHAIIGMAWFVVVIIAARSVRGFLNSRRGTRVVDGTAGVAMLGFAVALGVER